MSDETTKNAVDTLTPRQRLWLEYYLQTWNGNEAARRVNYSLPEKDGPRLLASPKIKAAIAERFRAQRMDADEALARLAEQARLNAADFFIFEEIEEIGTDGQKSTKTVIKDINWEVFKQRGRCIRKLSYSRDGRPVLEFHDQQAALFKIIDVLKLTSNAPVVNVQFDLAGWKREREERLRNIEGVDDGEDDLNQGAILGTDAENEG